MASRARRALSGSPAAPPVGADGIPGRLLRIGTGQNDPQPVADLEGTDPSEVAAVRAGWILLDAHERLSRRGAEKVFGREIAAWHAYAAATLGELTYTLPDGKELIPENRKNRLRFRRTLDFARRGEVVYDVGFGRGLLAAQLIKDRGIEHYHGIDIVDRYVKTATDLFAVNGLSPGSLNLEVGDLYELEPAKVAATGAAFVICCEVLEHVPDAELALKVLADALPEGADLLFSVPMHGRLESEWGHVSVFDVARLKDMLRGAGLYAHHVEPLANAWALVVASRDPGPSVRVREATGRPALQVAVPLSTHRDFVYVEAGDMSAIGAADISRKNAHSLICGLTDGTGVSFAVSGLTALRLHFNVVDASSVTTLSVRALAGDEVVAGWTWKVRPTDLQPGVTATSMRPGERSQQFVGGHHRGAERADRIELVATVAGGETASFNLRAAYLP